MKLKSNKAIQVFLVLAVLGIWGFAGYRFMGTTEETVVDIATPIKKKEIKNIHAGEYSLMANYRDPFLNNIPIAEEEVYIEEQQMLEKEFLPPPPVIWPTVEYHGQLKGKKGKEEVALITINGKHHLLKKGSALQGLKIDKLYPDSAKFRFSGEHKTIPAN